MMNMDRQTRIFVPRNLPFDNVRWSAIVIGQVIAQVVRETAYLDWYWFSRYDCTKEYDASDCDISQIPTGFMSPVSQHYRSVRFRYSLPNNSVDLFERECRRRIEDSGCAISDFRDYDLMADLTTDRYLDGETNQAKIRERASLVLDTYCSIARLIVHTLSGPDANGAYCLPHYVSQDQNSVFNVIHHLFCNMTDVYLFVDVPEHEPGTAVNPAQHVTRKVRVRF